MADEKEKDKFHDLHRSVKVSSSIWCPLFVYLGFL